jgi:hypothetical protein
LDQSDRTNPKFDVDLREKIEGSDISIHSIALDGETLLAGGALGVYVLIILDAETGEPFYIQDSRMGAQLCYDAQILKDRAYIVKEGIDTDRSTIHQLLINTPKESDKLRVHPRKLTIEGTIKRTQILRDGTLLFMYDSGNETFCVGQTDVKFVQFHPLGNLHEAFEGNKEFHKRCFPEIIDSGSIVIINCIDITRDGEFVLLVDYDRGRLLIVLDEKRQVKWNSKTRSYFDDHFCGRLLPNGLLLHAGETGLALENKKQKTNWELFDPETEVMDTAFGVVPFHSIASSEEGDFWFCWRNSVDNAHALVHFKHMQDDVATPPYQHLQGASDLLRYYPRKPTIQK